MTDEARALLIVAALLSGASGSVGGVIGRVTAPVPPAEVRYVTISAPAPPEPVAMPPVVEPAPAPPPEPPAVVETKPPPKGEAKPKAQVKPQAKPRPAVQKKSLPSCAFIKSEYERMSLAEQIAEYRRSTAEEVAHGRRCLGF